MDIVDNKIFRNSEIMFCFVLVGQLYSEVQSCYLIIYIPDRQKVRIDLHKINTIDSEY